jgi:hypothetical protein
MLQRPRNGPPSIADGCVDLSAEEKPHSHLTPKLSCKRT